ncbi:glycoside hydrolase family 2 TIM barrel-domain containing protein [Iamia majanohamensis]|uniref:Beta-galactosidase n=1 Tax=Iamia majanohamensis TaxID=467976 RepID=A0AAE9Y7V1_9ACTN|nr:glycoside hydrolase family 2 TIM barrel-domain containing protein [Iamia majanohamensis]WCO66048.1 glycoside hydrolase family 2 TIM barrel-domain containing protein [Iamia majanohamensis]
MPPATTPPGPLEALGPRSWARPEVTGVGREPLGTPLGRPDEVRLDGRWAFALRARPEDVTAEDLVGPTDGWDTVEVPGCWTVQGFDRPQYTNVQMPFPGPPPRVPEANPTGVHRTTLTVPEAWRGRRTTLEVGGAESVLYVHLDGVPVGMGKDSRLPQVFDLTDLVEPGRPATLALTVVRWSDATYLEDQDHWHHAGLHRSVVLRSTPPVRIADVHPTADRDPATGHGRLDLRVGVEAEGPGPRGWTVRAEVAGHRAEAPVHFEHPTDVMATWLLFEGRGATLALDVPDVAPWSAEAPHLHDLTVTLRDAEGEVVDEAVVAVGFRRVEVVGAELQVNGRPVLVKGVNRHDHDPRRGKAVTAASIERDVVLMKRHGLNAVRTSHYPNDSHLYDVCDRLGMYVVDEADLETHAHLRSLTRDPRWASAILERVVRMAQRDKAHPSIVMWSLGNESGSAPILQAAAEWLRAFDPSRPVHYEGSIGFALFTDIAGGTFPAMGELLHRPTPDSDVVAPMYPSVEDITDWATRATPDRPLVMCEYIHAMGNSCGGLADYWEAIRTHPGLQGGFAWDWVDQALVQTLPDGTERLAYGGDFGDEPNDGPFCCNGLVAADRTPHPSLLEMAKVVAPVRVRAVDPARGVLEVHNEHSFADLAWLTPSWTVDVDGEVVASGELAPLDLAAGARDELRLPVPAPDLAPGQAAQLTLTFRTREDLPWARAGHVVAWEQVELDRRPGPSVAPGPAPEAARGHAALEPTLALWRAPIDNETFGPAVGTSHAERWEAMGLRDAAARVGMTTEVVAADGGGEVVTHRVDVPADLDDIPRVGVRLRLGPGIRTVEWLGRGPHEGYADRREGTRVGWWFTPVDDWPVPYVHPQASGNRTDVRWLRLLDASGAPLVVIDHLDGLDVTVARWTDEEVAAAGHLEDLPVRDECYVWIDARHRGVGSGAVGPDVSPEHRVGPGPYRWSYRVR